MKKRLYLAQFQGRYGSMCFFPYSCGLIWAFARTHKEVADAYEMCGFLYAKEPIAKVIEKLDRPDLVCLSHYIWNAEYNKQFAHAIKEKWPHCVTLVGGVHVWENSSRTLEESPQFDFAIYGEGEQAFVDFLVEHTKYCPNYYNCSSLIWRLNVIPCWPDPEPDPEIVANPRASLVDVTKLRSPYLDGVFDSILPNEKSWTGSSETNRGCPYRCSFCAWGTSVLDKLRVHPDENVFGDLDWFTRNRISYIENCDANWGIINRDIDYVKRMVSLKQTEGFPQRFRAAWAKNSNEKVWEMANILHEADMLKAVTLAMQSMDDSVLQNIQRKNIKLDKFGELVKKYEEAGIPTYTELILGLAGESLLTHVQGIETILESGQHSGLNIYMNMMLPNTEQANPDYIERHGLKTCDMQAMLIHGTPEPDVPRERQLTVIATKAMPHEDWKQGWLYDRTIECFHCLGLLQHVARWFHDNQKWTYCDFYLSFQDWAESNLDTLAAQQFVFLRGILERGLAGQSWDCIGRQFGNISWPPEEYAFLSVMMEKDRFYDELRDRWFTEEKGRQILEEQREMIQGPGPDDNLEEWSREAVWYGRKGSRKYIKKVKV